MENNNEERVAIGGVYTRRAGCLLLPFLPIRAAGALIVTKRSLIFEPILYYKLLVRKQVFSLDEISGAEASGGNVELNLLDIVSIGRALKIQFKNGNELVFRSTVADQLAEAINQVVQQYRG